MMNITRSTNPAFRNVFEGYAFAGTQSEVMTMKGTVNKTILSLLLVILAASYTWKMVLFGSGNAMFWIFGGAIGGFIVALITAFKKQWSMYTVPVYSILQGLFLGGISAMFAASSTPATGAESAFNSQIVIKAVALTFGVFFMMLFAYRSEIIKPTEKFKMGVFAATGGIAVMYLVSWILGMFGVDLGFLHGNSMLSIGISIVIVIVAALNLILDFSFIEDGVKASAPKYMEWYGAFGLMVTLIWLYIEILRLLSKLSSRE